MKNKLIPGLVSVTFRQLSPEDIIDITYASGLKAVEWGSDVHLPAGKGAFPGSSPFSPQGRKKANRR